MSLDDNQPEQGMSPWRHKRKSEPQIATHTFHISIFSALSLLEVDSLTVYLADRPY